MFCLLRYEIIHDVLETLVCINDIMSDPYCKYLLKHFFFQKCLRRTVSSFNPQTSDSLTLNNCNFISQAANFHPMR